MKKLLDKIMALSEVDTGKAQPLYHTYPVINIYREDKREEAIPRERKELSDFPEDSYLMGMEGDGTFTKEMSEKGEMVLKPTACLVSRSGFSVNLPSLENPAISAKDIDTLAQVLEAAAGVDEKDPWTRDAYVYDFSEGLAEMTEGMKTAVPAGMAEEENEEEAELIWQEYYALIYRMISSVEETLNGEKIDPEAEKLGNLLLKKEYYENCYLKALKIKSLIKDELDLLLREYDVLSIPSGKDEKAEADFMKAANLTGLPFLKCPFGGPLLIGGANQEKKLLRMGKALEQKWGKK